MCIYGVYFDTVLREMQGLYHLSHQGPISREGC